MAYASVVRGQALVIGRQHVVSLVLGNGREVLVPLQADNALVSMNYGDTTKKTPQHEARATE